jgi:hypothetical protein
MESMAINWNYDEANVTEFELLPEGEYKVRISKLDDSRTTRNGDPMAVITCTVDGKGNSIDYYLCFLSAKPSVTDSNLKRIYASFPSIKKGSMPSQAWIGKVGKARIILDEYTGTDGEKHKSNKIDRFIPNTEAGDEYGGGLDIATDDLPF